jgi:hypothetical protein
MSPVHSMRYLFLATALLLAACSNGADRTAFLNTLVGQSQSELVRRIGVPTRSFVADGRTFLAYDEERSSTAYSGGTLFFGGFGGFHGGGFGYGAGLPTEIVPRRCETTFEIINDRVATWSLRGNACD